MRKIQRRKSDFMVKRQIGSAAYPQFKGLGCKTSGGRLLCTDRSGTEIFPNKQKCAGYIPEHCLPICKKSKERIKFILSYLEVKKHHYGWDMTDFNGNDRKDLNYG